MIYHAKAVKRAVKNALIVVDMPFMSYQTSVDDAVRNCGRVMKEVGVGAVKLEGGAYIAEIVRHLVKIGIPVMGHLGLTPQAINKFGTYEVRAQDRAEADAASARMRRILAEAGVFCDRPGEDPVRAGAGGHRRRSRSPRSASAPVRIATDRCWWCTTCWD